MAKLRKALTKPEDWQRHMRVLERLAAPKVVVRPKKRKPVRKMSFSAHKSILIDLDKSVLAASRGGNSDDGVNRSCAPTFQIKKKKWRPIDMERMYFLALPAIRVLPKIKDPSKVAARALTYRITKRTERLAALKKRPEIQLRTPGAVSPAAMEAIGSIRTFIQSLISCFIAQSLAHFSPDIHRRRGSMSFISIRCIDTITLLLDFRNCIYMGRANNSLPKIL